MHNKGAIPTVNTLRGNQKRVYSQALILCFLLTYENAVNFFFFGIVTLFIKRTLRTETVRFDEINKSLSK